MTQFAARYRAARAFAGISQDELADRLGVDAQTVKRREAGAKEPKKAELIAVAAICGVPLEFMENGWGRMTADELGNLVAKQNGLLAEQTQVLNQIKAAVAEQRELKTETDEQFRRLTLAIADRTPEASPPDSPTAPPKTAAATTKRAARSRTP